MIPLSTALRAGRRRIVLALASGRESLARLRADPAVALAIVCEGDLALTAYGTARALEEPLGEGVVAVVIEVERVDDHSRPMFVIDSGVQWRWTDDSAEERDVRVRAALERIAEGIHDG